MPPVAPASGYTPVPSVPPGRVNVVTLSGGALMVMLRLAFAVLAGFSESVTVTVKLICPTCGPVGLPVIAARRRRFSVSPAAGCRSITAQAYGVMPPAAASVSL